MCGAMALEEVWPADDGHRFRISIEIAGSSKVTGAKHHHDTEYSSHVQTIVVRAWDLPSALKQAAALPLGAWFSESDEELDSRARCPAGCGRFVKVGGRCSQEIRVYREGTFLGWEHP